MYLQQQKAVGLNGIAFVDTIYRNQIHQKYFFLMIVSMLLQCGQGYNSANDTLQDMHYFSIKYVELEPSSIFSNFWLFPMRI